jgi:uncharacterized membrane protein (DUF4010 family)
MENTISEDALQQTLRKRVKNSATTIELLGLIAVVGSIMLFLLSGLLILLVNMVIGSIIVVLGWKLRKDTTELETKQKLYYSALVWALIVFITNIFSGNPGAGMTVAALFLGASLIGLDSVRKLRNPAMREKELAAQNLKGKEKAKDVLLMFLIGGAVIGGFILVMYFVYNQ